MTKAAFWKADWFLGLVIAILLLFASNSRFFQSVERASDGSPSAQVAVIAIDDRSIANIGRWPWPRGIHSRLIDPLAIFQGREGKAAFQVDSFFDVANGKILAHKYRGKIVLIGATAAGVGAYQVAPISSAMPPVLLLALVAAHFVFLTTQLMWLQLMAPVLLLVIGHLTLDFESKRQFNKAQAVYDHTSAHNPNVRDLEPANIMWDPVADSVKVTDLGIARITDSSQIKSEMVLGTPSCMSPEHLAGKKIDGHSDLFALSAVDVAL